MSMHTSITLTPHVTESGDVPAFVLYRCFTDLLPISKESIRKNWRQRYPFFIRKKEGLYVDVRAVDLWLDERGKGLFSHALLARKRERNPGWTPVGVYEVAPPTITTATTKATKLDSAPAIENLGGVE